MRRLERGLPAVIQGGYYWICPLFALAERGSSGDDEMSPVGLSSWSETMLGGEFVVRDNVGGEFVGFGGLPAVIPGGNLATPE